jgi:hypothetical protein
MMSLNKTYRFIKRSSANKLSQSQSQSQSQSYVRTDGQSASLSCNKAPIWGLRPYLYYCQTVAGLFVWGALSDERTVLSFTFADNPRQHSHFRVRFRGTRDLYCLRFETSLSVASYDSQGYGGGIRSRLHTGVNYRLQPFQYIFSI